MSNTPKGDDVLFVTLRVSRIDDPCTLALQNKRELCNLLSHFD